MGNSRMEAINLPIDQEKGARALSTVDTLELGAVYKYA